MGKMQHIELKRLELRYFKGAKNVDIDFNHVTTVFGDNATGKSTIADAFSWLFFGKNMIGESDSKFTIKTLDENNNVIPKIEHSVLAVLDFDGQEITLKRTLEEKWVKKQGALETVFEGNVTKYHYNNVPKTKKEYEEKVNSILNEVIFKMISDPLAFNSLHWEKQRELLIAIAGNVSNIDIAAGNKDFEALLEKLVGKDLEEYRKELRANRLLLNKSIESIPTRIDEQVKSKPEVVDFKTAEVKKAKLESEILEVDNKIEDRNKAVESANAKRTAISNELFAIKSKNQNIEFEVKKQINSAPTQENPSKVISNNIDDKVLLASKYEIGVNNYTHNKTQNTNEIIDIEHKLSKLRGEFDVENARVLKFDEGSFNCPSCKRPLEVTDIESEKEKMLTDFKQDKKTTLERINNSGVTLKSRKEVLEEANKELDIKIANGKKLIAELNTEIASLIIELENAKAIPVEEIDYEKLLKEALEAHEEYQNNMMHISTLESTIPEAKTIDISDLKEQKTALQSELEVVKTELSKKDQIAAINKRVEELSKEESKLAQQIADIEKQEFIAQEFTIAKVSQIESKVNALFATTKFKLFEMQVNGTEVPTCKATYLGVDFNDLNTAGRIHCGIEIINALCKHYSVHAPIFLDNAESVVETPKTDSQLIRLVVSEPDKILRVV